MHKFIAFFQQKITCARNNAPHYDKKNSVGLNMDWAFMHSQRSFLDDLG